MSIIRVFSLCVAIFIWAVVGLYLWIPAVIISLVLYIALIFYGALTEETALVRSTEEAIQEILSVYKEGFRKIHATVYSEGDGSPIGLGSEGSNAEGERPGLLASVTMFLVVAGFALALATLVWFGILSLLDWLLHG